ncbi:hypothetical protein D3C78_934560 [compost metagenome]
MPGIPRVVGRRVAGMVSGEGAFGHLQLAEHHRAGLAQTGDHGGVLRRNEITVNRHAGSGRYAGGPQQVLVGDGDAVQRAAAFAAHQLAFGLARLFQGQFRGDAGVAVQVAVEPVNARQLRLGDLDRRQLAGADQQRQFVHLQIVQIGHA